MVQVTLNMTTTPKCVCPQDSEVEITELIKPIHSNFSGKIHGGYILNLMDKSLLQKSLTQALALT